MNKNKQGKMEDFKNYDIRNFVFGKKEKIKYNYWWIAQLIHFILFIFSVFFISIFIANYNGEYLNTAMERALAGTVFFFYVIFNIFVIFFIMSKCLK